MRRFKVIVLASWIKTIRICETVNATKRHFTVLAGTLIVLERLKKPMSPQTEITAVPVPRKIDMNICT